MTKMTFFFFSIIAKMHSENTFHQNKYRGLLLFVNDAGIYHEIYVRLQKAQNSVKDHIPLHIFLI